MYTTLLSKYVQSTSNFIWVHVFISCTRKKNCSDGYMNLEENNKEKNIKKIKGPNMKHRKMKI